LFKIDQPYLGLNPETKLLLHERLHFQEEQRTIYRILVTFLPGKKISVRQSSAKQHMFGMRMMAQDTNWLKSNNQVLTIIHSPLFRQQHVYLPEQKKTKDNNQMTWFLCTFELILSKEKRPTRI
jgi:hypothetical protein